MQTPVLEVLLERQDFIVRPSDLRMLDTPEGRWEWLLRDPDLVAEAVREADSTLLEMGEGEPLSLDHRDCDLFVAAADRFDASWEVWEQTAYARLAAALRRAGATPLEYNGHMDGTLAALERGRQLDPSLSLRAARVQNPAPDERALAGAVIDQVRLELVPVPWRAAFAPWEVSELVTIVDETARIAGTPTLVLSARLPQRLLSLYRWSEANRERLEHQGSPIVAARVIADDGDGGSIIIHREINDIDDLAELEAAWKGRGPLCSVVSASCLIDRVWQADWAPALRSAGPSMVLVDIELDRFAPSWRDAETVKAALVRVDDPSGNRWALAVEASNQPILWLALADEVTTALLLEQLRRTPDIHPAVTTEHLAAWHETLPIALTHILATESFLDFDGLTGVL